MSDRTYSLPEACDVIRGSHEPADLEWVSKRLRSGVFVGYKPGRNWRMTEEQVRENVRRLQPKSVVVPDVPLSGMTRTSRRRLAS